MATGRKLPMRTAGSDTPTSGPRSTTGSRRARRSPARRRTRAASTARRSKVEVSEPPRAAARPSAPVSDSYWGPSSVCRPCSAALSERPFLTSAVAMAAADAIGSSLCSARMRMAATSDPPEPSTTSVSSSAWGSTRCGGGDRCRANAENRTVRPRRGADAARTADMGRRPTRGARAHPAVVMVTTTSSAVTDAPR